MRQTRLPNGVDRRRARAPLALVVAACGDDDGEESGSTGGSAATAFPVTIDAANGEVAIEARPEAIVSLSPTATEMLFAIGAGDQVVAVDSTSDYPADAPMTDLSGVRAQHRGDRRLRTRPGRGLGRHRRRGRRAATPSTSRCCSPGRGRRSTTATRRSSSSGAATGHVGTAAELVAQMQSDIDGIVADLPEREEPLTYYHELDDTLLLGHVGTFIGELYSLAGAAQHRRRGRGRRRCAATRSSRPSSSSTPIPT